MKILIQKWIFNIWKKFGISRTLAEKNMINV